MTDRYAVFGNPIAHSISPQIHLAFAKSVGQSMSYERIEAPLDGFAESVRRFRDEGGCGLNVTVPFKIEALALADDIHPRARLVGASNCLTFEKGRIHAENFDGIGLVRDLKTNLGWSIEGRRILIAGAGGAARGAIGALLEEKPAAILVVNRDRRKAEAIVSELGNGQGVELQACGYGDLPAGPAFDLVVNSTSASLTGARPAIEDRAFGPATAVYDMAYGKGLTPFLAQAKEAGSDRLADGVGMLVEQAAEAFARWRGVRPPTAAIIDTMTVPLD